LLAFAAVLGLGVLALGASSGMTWIMFGGVILIGIGFSFDVIENTLLQALVPEEFLSRVYSVNILVSFALLPAGYAVSGVLAGSFGPAWVLAAGGGALACTCLFAGVTRGLRDVDAAVTEW